MVDVEIWASSAKAKGQIKDNIKIGRIRGFICLQCVKRFYFSDDEKGDIDIESGNSIITLWK